MKKDGSSLVTPHLDRVEVRREILRIVVEHDKLLALWTASLFRAETCWEVIAPDSFGERVPRSDAHRHAAFAGYVSERGHEFLTEVSRSTHDVEACSRLAVLRSIVERGSTDSDFLDWFARREVRRHEVLGSVQSTPVATSSDPPPIFIGDLPPRIDTAFKFHIWMCRFCIKGNVVCDYKANPCRIDLAVERGFDRSKVDEFERAVRRRLPLNVVLHVFEQ